MGTAGVDPTLFTEVERRMRFIREIFQENLGRELTDSDMSTMLRDISGVQPLPKNDLEAKEQLEIDLSGNRVFVEEGKAFIDTKINQAITDKFGITDQGEIDKIKDYFQEFKSIPDLVGTGTMPKDIDIDTLVTGVANLRDAILISAYGSEFKEITGRDPTDEEVDAFLDSHDGDSLGLGAITTGDYREIRDGINDLSSTIREDLEGDPNVTPETPTTEVEGITIEEFKEDVSKAQDKLATSLAEGRGTLEERVREAHAAYAEGIPERISEYKASVEGQLERTQQRFERDIRETLNLRRGGEQKIFAEAIVERAAQAGERIGEFGLREQQQLAQQRLGAEIGLAELEQQQQAFVGELGLSLAGQVGIMGREEFTQNLQFQRQLQLQRGEELRQQFLNRLGFQQQISAQQQQFGQQLGLLGVQQSFQAQQAQFDRQLQERLFNRRAELFEQQQSRARKTARVGAISGLIGTGVGAGLGFALGGPAGALLGAGILGGQPGLATAGAFNLFK